MSKSDFQSPFADESNPVKELVSQVMGTHRSSQVDQEDAVESKRKRPRYPSEGKRIQHRVSLDLGAEVKDVLYRIVEDIADRQQLSAVSRALMEYALNAYETGQITIEPRLGKSGVYFKVIESSAEHERLGQIVST